MGQSTPTTTMAFDTFEHRYSAFRNELHPREQQWFDELVCRARRHSSAVNRRPHMDFERPVMLAMLMEGMRELDDTRKQLQATARQLEQACRAMEEAGMMQRRVQALPLAELTRVGQTRIAA